MHGQVVGVFTARGGSDHAFLYGGGTMKDLGTLGGADSTAFDINDAGQVVGAAKTAGGFHHAFIYRGGKMTDLGTLGGDSCAYHVNSKGQAAGYCGHPEWRDSRRSLRRQGRSARPGHPRRPR